VEAHVAACPDKPIQVALTDQAGRFEIEVINAGAVPSQAHGSPSGQAALLPPGFSLAVIAGLADDVQISETSAGTSVKMSWPLSDSLAAGSPA
jgi:hypothetical protein